MLFYYLLSLLRVETVFCAAESFTVAAVCRIILLGLRVRGGGHFAQSYLMWNSLLRRKLSFADTPLSRRPRQLLESSIQLKIPSPVNRPEAATTKADE